MKEKEKAVENREKNKEESLLERSKEHIWLDVANKLVKVKVFQRTLQYIFLLQVHPLVPVQANIPEKNKVDYGSILSLIGMLTLASI